jgi:hypothetical protein
VESPAISSPNLSRSMRVRLPFISTSFANNLWYYALLWPVWWALGIEQFLLPFFTLYELARFLIRVNWQVRINTTGFIALLLALWWLVPVFWVDREFLDIYLKETASIWSQAILIILVFNCVKSRQDWWLVIRALTIMAAYTAIGGMIYLSGLWRGSFPSLFGLILPQSMIDDSAFFTSISVRQFGSVAREVGLIPIRLRAFSLSYSSLSMACLLLIPFAYWRMKISQGNIRLIFGGMAIGLLFCLIFTESRMSYLAFIAALLMYWILRLGLLRGHNRPFSIALTFFGIAVALLVGYIAQRIIMDILQSAFVDLRPSSWLVRFNIYVVTLRLLPEHFIAGWGVPVRIPGASSVYSAGTHSSYLGILFQHGIVGLILYLGLWVSIWKYVIQGLRQKLQNREVAFFWITIATSFFAFNIRELADTWLWDQSLTFILWLMWGATITATSSLTAGETID